MKRLEEEPQIRGERRMEVTVTGPTPGSHDPRPVTTTIQALVRTRLIWRGRSMIFAGEDER